MDLPSRGIAVAALRIIRLAAIASAALLACNASPSRTEDPCTEDAMIVFDASGSVSGVEGLGVATTVTRIDKVRSALSRVLPSVARLRRVGLITYGPGTFQQCSVKLDLKPTP